MNVLIVRTLNATWVSLCVMCSACMERPSKQIHLFVIFVQRMWSVFSVEA